MKNFSNLADKNKNFQKKILNPLINLSQQKQHLQTKNKRMKKIIVQMIAQIIL